MQLFKIHHPFHTSRTSSQILLAFFLERTSWDVLQAVVYGGTDQTRGPPHRPSIHHRVRPVELGRKWQQRWVMQQMPPSRWLALSAGPAAPHNMQRFPCSVSGQLFYGSVKEEAVKFPGLVFSGRPKFTQRNNSHRGPLTQVGIDERPLGSTVKGRESEEGEEMERKGKAEGGPWHHVLCIDSGASCWCMLGWVRWPHLHIKKIKEAQMKAC